MRVIESTYLGYKLYNERTNEIIVEPNKSFNINSPSLVAVWHEGIFENPIINNEILTQKWDDYLRKLENDVDEYCLERFLQRYENEDWIVFRLIDASEDKVWLIVDKDVKILEFKNTD